MGSEMCIRDRIGAEQALELILAARPVDTAQARSLGFLDDVIEGHLQQGAIACARKLIAEKRGVRRTGSRNVDAATATPSIFERLTEQARRTYPNRTAGLVAIEAVRAAATLPLAQGLEFETKLVNECKASAESKGAVHAFFAERETRRVPGLPDPPAAPVRSAGIIGAGTMGGGIAICFANAGIPVTLLDSGREALDRGIANIDGTYESMVKRGRLTAAEKAQRMALIQGRLEYAALADADVIVDTAEELLGVL